jgi:hypothetical protein
LFFAAHRLVVIVASVAAGQVSYFVRPQKGAFVEGLMTEAEWLATTDPTPMLEFLQDLAVDRKLRLFTVACCRRVWPRLKDERSRRAVESAEQFADDREDAAALLRAHLGALRAAVPNGGFSWDPSFAAAEAAIQRRPGPNPSSISLGGAFAYYESTFAQVVAISVLRGMDQDAEGREFAAQADLLRDIYGNPFCPVALSPEWRTSTTVGLARQMYDSRDFGAMPILADAMQDAGCDNEDILDHCRSAGPHVRGCWVVDLVLCKK